MLLSDLDGVLSIAAQVHPSFPEDRCVFEERQRLYPAGCHVLDRGDGSLGAYALSHPGLWLEVPSLNSLLGALPGVPTCYYFHDLALVPEARAQGYAQELTLRIEACARACGQDRIAGVSVNQSLGFWLKQGFAVVDPLPEALRAKLLSYEAAARYLVRNVPPAA